MENLSDFYSLFLNISITFIGILLAAVFFLFQIIHNRFQKTLSKLLNLPLILLLLCSAILVGYSGMAILKINTSFNDYLPWWDFGTKNTISSPFNMFLVVIFFFLIIFGSIGYFLTVVKYINPLKVIDQYEKVASIDTIKNYLFRIKGIPEPVMFRIVLDDSDEEKLVAEQKIYDNSIREYNKLKSNIKFRENPIEPITEVILDASNKSEIVTVRKAYKSLLNISVKFLSTLKQDEGKIYWSNLERLLPDQYCEVLFADLEVCLDRFAVLNFNGGINELISFIQELLNSAISLNNDRLFRNILDKSKIFEGKLINKFPNALKKLIRMHDELAKIAIKSKNPERFLVHLCQNMITMCEKVIRHQEFDQDHKYLKDNISSFFSEIRGAYIEIANLYHNPEYRINSVIFLDLISILLDLFKEFTGNGKITWSQFEQFCEDVSWILPSIAITSIKQGMFEITHIVLRNINEAYPSINAQSSGKGFDTMLGVLEIGLVCADHNEGKTNIDINAVEEKVNNMLVTNIRYSSNTIKVNKAVHEAQLRYVQGANYQERERYLRDLGILWQTDFGFLKDTI